MRTKGLTAHVSSLPGAKAVLRRPCPAGTRQYYFTQITLASIHVQLKSHCLHILNPSLIHSKTGGLPILLVNGIVLSGHSHDEPDKMSGDLTHLTLPFN